MFSFSVSVKAYSVGIITPEVVGSVGSLSIRCDQILWRRSCAAIEAECSDCQQHVFNTSASLNKIGLLEVSSGVATKE